jgi:hypothetical protein
VLGMDYCTARPSATGTSTTLVYYTPSAFREILTRAQPLNPNAPAATTTAAGSGSGAAATAATTATTDAAPTPAVAAAHTEHPIMTTTNAVPHNNAAGDDAQQ